MLFQSTGKKVMVEKRKRKNAIEVNRNILATLLALSAKHSKPIDFEVALRYPLCSVPLSLAHPDGTRRKTTKNSLMKVINSYKHNASDDLLPLKKNCFSSGSNGFSKDYYKSSRYIQ